MLILGPDINQMIIHNTSLLKRCRHISNLKCAKLIRGKHSVRKGIRLIHDFNILDELLWAGRCYTQETIRLEYDKIAHSPGAAAPADISPFTSLSCVSSPSDKGVRKATSSIPGSSIFKETWKHLSRLSLLWHMFVKRLPTNKAMKDS